MISLEKLHTDLGITHHFFPVRTGNKLPYDVGESWKTFKEPRSQWAKNRLQPFCCAVQLKHFLVIDIDANKDNDGNVILEDGKPQYSDKGKYLIKRLIDEGGAKYYKTRNHGYHIFVAIDRMKADEHRSVEGRPITSPCYKKYDNDPNSGVDLKIGEGQYVMLHEDIFSKHGLDAIMSSEVFEFDF